MNTQHLLFGHRIYVYGSAEGDTKIALRFVDTNTLTGLKLRFLLDELPDSFWGLIMYKIHKSLHKPGRSVCRVLTPLPHTIYPSIAWLLLAII